MILKKDGTKIELVFVEDNDGDALLISDYLEEYFSNLHLIRSSSFKELISLQVNPDCILLDLNLPDKTGKDLITEVHKLFPKTPILILTGFTDLDFAIEALEMGASDYLLKDELSAGLLYKSIRYSIERHKYLEQLKASEQHLSKAIIKAIENEQYAIGAELHDNVCQTLVASHLKLNMIAGKLDDVLREKVDKSVELIATALKDIQQLSRRMAPAYLNRFTLDQSISNLVNSLQECCPFILHLQADETISNLLIDEDLHLNIYRIIQEQLRNTLKHAQAEHVSIHLAANDAQIQVVIEDNGVGFDLEQLSKGIGITNMKRRAQLNGGELELISSPGNGCRLDLMMPYTN